MYYIEEIKIEKAAALLRRCGLLVPSGTDYTAALFTTDGRIVATGSLKKDMIQGVAVDPADQGEDLTAKLMTHLIEKGMQSGFSSLYLFTKPEKTAIFTGLGFRLAASASPYAALLEWGAKGIEQFAKNLSTERKQAGSAAALVMNCNPFTKGHRYLIEYAAERKEQVYVLAVEEDASLFSFRDRLAMLRAGVSDLSNVSVIPGGRYVVSALTFPSYFTGEEKQAEAHGAIDGTIFAQYIAPALGVDQRFLGTEPLSAVTRTYNRMLKSILPQKEIQVIEIPRLTAGGQIISASSVRKLLRRHLVETGTLSDLFSSGSETERRLKQLIPETTEAYLRRPEILNRLASVLLSETGV